MDTPFEGFPESAEKIVYVRAVVVADLPEDVRVQVGEQVGETEVIYSVHAPNGKRLAFVADRRLAFNLARAHDFAPVSVH